MSLYVVNSTALKESEFEIFKSNPEFRKATRNMLQAYAVIDGCLKKLPESVQNSLKNEYYQNVGLVLGTSLGELEVTKDFLLTLQNQGMARPILFQNSLHNATLGFLTLHMKLVGPSATISERFFTAESALQTAELFLASGEVSLAIVVCTEVLIQEFLPGYSRVYPKGTDLVQGACAFLVANEQGLSEFSLTPEFSITAISCLRKNVTAKPLSSYYDSDGLEKIRKPSSKLIILDKPDGSQSTISIGL